jgi:hypothetical protein
MLPEVLTGQGFRLVLARDGREALFVARHLTPNRKSNTQGYFFPLAI